ncbi:MAG: hypothetical protein EBR49_07970 [Betaproteobacteria bacterium]|nr:hypothetical protein [Betaproteobacteria bacterium]
MQWKQTCRLLAVACAAALVTGCATAPPFDYTAYKESRPRSILVLPPLNSTPEVYAPYSVLSQATFPLAESGYYVFPVSLVTETFRENGMTQPAEMHGAAPEKLRQIFGADAALYVNISKYGSSFQVVNSVTVVTADAKLMDLKTGKLLWAGNATASSEEGQNNQQGGLAVLLVAAIVKQVIASTTDQSHKIAGMTANRLMSAGQRNGLLYGPRSSKYGKD